MLIVALHNQTLLDITVQYCGTVAAYFDVLELNPGLADDITAGQLVEIPEKDYGKRLNVDYYKENKIEPATMQPITRKTQHLFETDLFEIGLFE